MVTQATNGGTTKPYAHSTAARRRGSLVVLWMHPSWRSTVLEDGLVFGRDESNGAPLPGSETSRRHAELSYTGLLPKLRDLQSRNGTWRNGERVVECSLGPGDVLRIGEWLGVVCEVDPAEPLEPRELSPGWYGGPTLARAVRDAEKAATRDLPVAIEGETGTGKEGLARAIHGWSGRRGRLVAINCATLAPSLADAQLFGYEKGAFTGATKASPGFFRNADRGTIFLDEVLELPTDVQSKLLRVLQEREVQPLGADDASPIDVRVVCASQKPLEQAVHEGRFRQDLQARLEGLRVRLPPLRDRKEDVVPLLLRMLGEHTSGRPPALDTKLVEALLLYPWPLNVREVAMLAGQLVALHADEPKLKRAMLPERIAGAAPAGPAPLAVPAPERSASERAPEDDPQWSDLVAALRRTEGHVTRAAAEVHIHRSKANRLLRAHGVDASSFRRKADGRS